MSNKKFLGIIALLLGAAISLYLLTAGPGKESDAASNKNLFYGVRQASPAEIRKALPDGNNKPLLVEFYSKYCHDCKKMAPHLEAIAPKFPQITFRRFEIQADRKTHPLAFETFQPRAVPVLLFIQPNGKITNVLYGYQSPEILTGEFQKLSSAADVKSAPNVKPGATAKSGAVSNTSRPGVKR